MTEVLTQAQIDEYRETGGIVVEGRLSAQDLAEIRAAIAQSYEEARGLTASTDRLDLEDSHAPDDPRIRRIKLPHTQYEVFQRLMTSDAILAPARDLIGPNLRLHTTKLNMKMAGYGAAVEWHQDMAFYPHTNDDVLAMGVMIDDMEAENGPLMIFPGSHRGPTLDHHADGVFVGAVDLAANGLDLGQAKMLTGPAGSVSIHHGRVLHGSGLNTSDRDRRLLFYEMMAADSFPVMGSMTGFASLEEYDTRMLCGQPTIQPRLTDWPVRIPLPHPSDRGSIYEIQKGLKHRGFSIYDTDEGSG
ncbi:phytanoyl-CoA dioxygenase family protein [Candidatus Rhodobacter oscarellae]|uniref:Phytanoyl-CoA dioxygenase family protein n=1 Tax=Candidatus Rhodobacter oscarellae TaxID=1675527 RepID=A0A0J9GTJ6_9RHOB|nr:phytanoyl-CoA dioxygenase family protein [Candidatus Rhodobacter lobularis]KMW56823.1 phytanoyl-CoA dioxygenase family protein [Candidatus Rhodobacter lobularis]